MTTETQEQFVDRHLNLLDRKKSDEADLAAIAAAREGKPETIKPRSSSEIKNVNPGWAPGRWARLLRERAKACRAIAPAIADKYERDANEIENALKALQ